MFTPKVAGQFTDQDHLKDFDPATSPVAVDPVHIETAALDYYNKYWKEYWVRLHEKHGIEVEQK